MPPVSRSASRASRNGVTPPPSSRRTGAAASRRPAASTDVTAPTVPAVPSSGVVVAVVANVPEPIEPVAVPSLSIDAQRAHNAAAHHTDVFAESDGLVLRRAQVALTRAVVTGADVSSGGAGAAEWRAVATAMSGHGVHPSFECPMLPEAALRVESSRWGLVVSPLAEAGAFEVRLCIDPEAPIGRYTIALSVSIAGVGSLAAVPFGAIVLCNPWSSTDTVHLPDEAMRAEYVLNEAGAVYQVGGAAASCLTLSLCAHSASHSRFARILPRTIALRASCLAPSLCAHLHDRPHAAAPRACVRCAVFHMIVHTPLPLVRACAAPRACVRARAGF